MVVKLGVVYVKEGVLWWCWLVMEPWGTGTSLRLLLVPFESLGFGPTQLPILISITIVRDNVCHKEIGWSLSVIVKGRV